MRRRGWIALAVAGGCASLVAGSATAASASGDDETVVVRTSADSGNGSLRAAIAAANADRDVEKIVFVGRLAPVALASTVTYTGKQSLEIEGNGTVVDGAGIPSGAALATLTGGDLEISRLTVRNAPGEGISIRIPAGATGTKRVELERVTIVDNGGHGVLVRDQDNPEVPDTDPPTPPDPAGSPASLAVSIEDATITGNGDGAADRDGVRIDEGAAGNLRFSLERSRVKDNGGDGVELDERGTGSVDFSVERSNLDGNGGFTAADYDDGMDIDESGDGNVRGKVTDSTASSNFEEGLDFNENDAGDLDVSISRVTTNGNREEGVDLEEDDDFAGGGALRVTVDRLVANGNCDDDGDGGLKVREKGTGDLFAKVERVEASGNLAGAADNASGIFLRESEDGRLDATVDRATTRSNAADGVQIREAGVGDLAAKVSRSVSETNASAGVRARQQDAGIGEITVTDTTLTGNTAGGLVLQGVTQLP